MKARWLPFLALLLIACPDNPHPVQTVPSESLSECPGGQFAQLPTERGLCVYRWGIVIETGFDCPAQRPDRADFSGRFITCSDFGRPVGVEEKFLLDRYGVPGRPWPIYDAPSPTETDELDILWVIDNSGSMCQEQAVLRDNFEMFVEEIASHSVDFHIAVTTTDTNPTYALEPVASPGVLQSTPQPVPGFDRSCHTAVDEAGDIVPGDYAPIIEALDVAVGCMESPDETLLDPTDAEIECALYARPAGCAIERVGCDGDCTPESIFPPPASYRQIPRVLRSADYRAGDGSLDVDRFKQDFACASMVGTRGYGIEKGLGAAVAAVSPELVDGPNAGFLRTDARFAVMFVTDENDCTHDGSIPEDTACGGDACEFWNRTEHLGGPLVPVVELQNQMLANLSVSKGRTVAQEEVFVGSIHGIAQRYEGDRPTDAQCKEPDYSGIEPTCVTSLGIAFSGDRYERFLLQFPPGNFFPEPTGADAMMTGWMCNGDFRPALAALGEWLAGAVAPGTSDDDD